MTNDGRTRPLDVLFRDFKRLGTAAWIAIVALVVVLAVAIVGVYYSGTGDLAGGVSTAGYIAMALGVLFTLVVGAGLMALTFYSSRQGHDEPPSRQPMDEDGET